MILLKPRVKPVVSPLDQIQSNYRCSKNWLGDVLMCQCTFPPQRMREGWFGYTCENDQCSDFVSKKDAKYLPRTPLDTKSVGHFMRSNIMRRVMRAEKTGEYMRAHTRD